MTVPLLQAQADAAEVGTSIELFTGGGGLAVAMHRAGFRHLLAVEFDSRACETLRAGEAVRYGSEVPLPQALSDPWPLIEGDVHSVDFRRLNGQVDVVAGGVPCQPWSLGGAHRGYEDKRNLWPELFRCVRETKPRAILAENVKGLLRPSFRPYYDYIIRELSAPFEERVDGEEWQDHDRRLAKALQETDFDPTCRYDVRFALVNAADYGVPQIRWRVFVVAFRKDLGLANWDFPAATHSETALWHDQSSGDYWKRHKIAPRLELVPGQLPVPDGRQPWRTIRDAIADLPEPLKPLKAKLEHPGYLHHYGWPGARSYPGHEPNDLDRPAKTIKAGVHGVPGGETVLRLDNGSIRYMTVREVARVMTFPDDRRLAGPRGEQIRQLGNAVPVDLAKVMAEAVARALRAMDNDATPGSWASSPAVRSVMRGNKSRDTKPELALRSAVHALGLRYRVGVRPLPELRRTADLVFGRAKVAVFLDGCYWHGCPEHHRPAKRNTEFWETKIQGNIARDADTDACLREAGWQVVRVWEHEEAAIAAKRIHNLITGQS